MSAAGPRSGDAGAGEGVTRTQVRGSALLMAGRVVSTGLNFLVQVLIVRALTPGDFGAFAYALSVVAICQSLTTLGLQRSLARFLPVYLERADRRAFASLLAATAAAMLTVGLAVAVVVAGTAALGGGSTGLARDLLLILIVLAPVQAFDHQFFETLFATFRSPMPIVVRQHIVAPLARLAVVAALIVVGGSARFLAIGYVAIGILGVLLYLPLAVRLLRSQGILRWPFGAGTGPGFRMAIGFALPLLTVDAVLLARTGVDAVLVQAIHGPTEVAVLRAVEPVARLNDLVLVNFALLFMPAAARLIERRDPARVTSLYWHTAAWQALLGFPIFATTFALATPVTTLLFGARYESSGTILAILAVGGYVSALLGQNGLTLQAFGRVRYIVLANVTTVIANVALALVLIPPFGALGAAAATSAALLLLNVIDQVGLRRLGVDPLPHSFRGLYLQIAMAVAAVTGLQLLVAPPLPLGLAAVALVWLLLVRLNRHALAIGPTFPELLRLPFVGRLLGLRDR